MTSESQALVPQNESFSLAPQNLEQAMQYAKLLADSTVVPVAFQKKPPDILIAVQLGMELGLSPVQALQSIAVINGRPTLWGDGVLGLVRSSGKLEWIKETDDGHVATCTVKRKGEPEPVSRMFSQDDAKVAGLAGKAGPWQQYPGRMRMMRARSWALRDVFTDVLKGLSVREEVEDYNVVGTTEQGHDIMRRPSRAGTAPTDAEIAEFTGKKPNGNGHPSAPAAASSPASGVEFEHVGVISTEDGTIKKGPRAGATFLKAKLARANGESIDVSAFSETAAAAIREACGAGLGVRVKIESKTNSADGKVYHNVTEAHVIADSEEAQA